MARPSAIVALQSSSVRADPSNPRDANVLRIGKGKISVSTLSNVANLARLTRCSAKQCIYSVSV